MQLEAFYADLRLWSRKTFGTPAERGPVGALKHLEKEAREAYLETDEDKRTEEIADCLILVFDVAQRHGLIYSELADEHYIQHLYRKFS